MGTLKTGLSLFALVILSGIAGATNGLSQEFRFEYAAKFVCAVNIPRLSN